MTGGYTYVEVRYTCSGAFVERLSYNIGMVLKRENIIRVMSAPPHRLLLPIVMLVVARWGNASQKHIQLNK